MASFNRVILVGNLTQDIELRYTPAGTAVTDVSMAVNERVKRNDEWIEEANFFDVTLWGRTAEVASEYLSKGSPLLIEGRLKLDRWEQDGQKRSKIKIIGERMQMLGTRSGSAGGAKPHSHSTHNQVPHSQGVAQGQSASMAESQNPVAPPDDEVPF